MTRIVLCFLGLCLILPCLSRTTFSATTGELNLRDFGAVGDGVTNDGPAFQAALDALAQAGGGTLFVPEGKYAITTPVVKNFAGLASSITITGVESLKAVSPPSAPGSELAEGLDLLTEVYPRTGEPENAISIFGLRTLVVKDIAFVGTAGANTDAAVTLYLSDIDKAQIKHSEFYGLSTLVGGGAIVSAIRSDLEITQCKFLGSTATSGGYLPVVQNLEWRGITVTNSVFLDYGLRELFSKTGLAAPISWINIGNAAAVTNHSPRREVVIRNIFLDEGGYWGISSLPYRYLPASAPIDLIYVSGLEMNVSNFGQYGHLFYDAQRVLIEDSRYGWSHNAAAAIGLANVGTAILDQLLCEADADHIAADANTGELTVINSTYAQLDSQARITNAFNTETADEDPVQYVRNRFAAVLEREPDAAAHFYWSDLLIRCGDNSDCVNAGKAALNDYLSTHPSAKFAIAGRIADKNNVPLEGVTVTLSGSQSVTTTTDANGNYAFSNLPTSGRYVITPSKHGYFFEAASAAFVTPSGDRTANFIADLTHTVKGTINAGGTPLAGVVVAVSGSTTGTATTDSNGAYSFELHAGGNYVLTPAKSHYTFNPATKSVNDPRADTQVDFSATIEKHSISGRVVDSEGAPLAGVMVTLSGSANATTSTPGDGSYSFTNIDGGSNCTVSAAKDGYLLTPAIQTFNDLAADTKADFQAALLPRLLTAEGSDRAIALELTTLIADPFPITNTFLSGGRNRTRVLFFGKDLRLQPGEGVEVMTAEAEDGDGVRYPLRVEYVSPLPDLAQVSQIVIRLTGELEDAGDVYVTVKVHDLTSNKVRIAIGHFSDDPSN